MYKVICIHLFKVLGKPQIGSFLLANHGNFEVDNEAIQIDESSPSSIGNL